MSFIINKDAPRFANYSPSSVGRGPGRGTIKENYDGFSELLLKKGEIGLLGSCPTG